jgi:hypothetical protein
MRYGTIGEIPVEQEMLAIDAALDASVLVDRSRTEMADAEQLVAERALVPSR